MIQLLAEIMHELGICGDDEFGDEHWINHRRIASELIAEGVHAYPHEITRKAEYKYLLTKDDLNKALCEQGGCSRHAKEASDLLSNFIPLKQGTIIVNEEDIKTAVSDIWPDHDHEGGEWNCGQFAWMELCDIAVDEWTNAGVHIYESLREGER